MSAKQILLKSRLGVPDYSHIIHYHLEKSAGLGIINRIQVANTFTDTFGAPGFPDPSELLKSRGMNSIHHPSVVGKCSYSFYINNNISTSKPGFYSFHGEDVIFPNPLFTTVNRCISFTVLREPVSRLKSLVRYMFRRRMISSRSDLISKIQSEPFKFYDYMTRYFLSGDCRDRTISSSDVQEAFTNLSLVDWVFPQSDSNLLNSILSASLSTFQLPNVLSPLRMNISSSDDLPSDFSEDELDDIAHKFTLHDQELFKLASPLLEKTSSCFSVNSFGQFDNSAIHPLTCVIQPEETIGGPFKASHGFVPTSKLLGSPS